MTKKRMIAFWRYDLFPFVLGSEVTKMDDRGRVVTKGYGPGHWFTPIKLLPLKSGLALLAKLQALASAHGAERAALDRDFRERAETLFEAAL